VGGPLALVKNGDRIIIDAVAHQLTLDVPQRELTRRKKALKLRSPVFHRGVLAKYASHVSQAHLGAITDGSL
jgi:dihydroxy-acid dehydratase